MQTIWTKKAVITLLLTNLASVSYIAKDTLSRHLHFGSKKARVAHSQEAPMQRHGVVEPVYFKNSDEIQSCYEQLLTKAPKHDEGSVLVNLTVTKEGSVDHLNLVQSDFDEPSFNDCLMTTIKATRLPASDERAGVLIAHKFNFHRKNLGHINFAE